MYAHGFHQEKEEQTQTILSRHRYETKQCWQKYKSYTYFSTTSAQAKDQWVCTNSFHKKMKDIVSKGATEKCPKYVSCSTVAVFLNDGHRAIFNAFVLYVL